MSDTFSELNALIPSVGKYRKLIASIVTSSFPFAIFLASAPHSAVEILAATQAYVLLNLGVYGVKNERV